MYQATTAGWVEVQGYYAWPSEGANQVWSQPDVTNGVWGQQQYAQPCMADGRRRPPGAWMQNRPSATKPWKHGAVKPRHIRQESNTSQSASTSSEDSVQGQHTNRSTKAERITRHARQESTASQQTTSTDCDGLERIRWADLDIATDVSEDESDRMNSLDSNQLPKATEVGNERSESPSSAWSVGSELHHVGRCNPCAFHHKDKGCKSGRDCNFCHRCPPGEAARRQKLQQSLCQKLPHHAVAWAIGVPRCRVVQEEEESNTNELADDNTNASTHENWSEGSKLHESGRCKPCAFMWTKGCTNGAKCTFCHLCPAREVQRRKNLRRQMYMRLQQQQLIYDQYDQHEEVACQFGCQSGMPIMTGVAFYGPCNTGFMVLPAEDSCVQEAM
mmetsp:Transcript_19163/g.44629  ORF Transcript_19163/g.44629 Transcript_19163/m.44629 type:complete len:388 (+) Transcript_19163:69-1232(+)